MPATETRWPWPAPQRGEPVAAAMPLVHLVGAPASGKTTLGRRLSDKLGLVFIQKDDIITRFYDPRVPSWPDLAWRAFGRSLKQLERPAVVETLGITPQERPFLADHLVLRVRVVASRKVQRQRLRERDRLAPWVGNDWETLLRSMRDTLAPDVEIRGDGDVEAAYRDLLGAARDFLRDWL